ncbi:MAG: hypothetical protein Q9205_005272 [Flavoplaca limonia]
MPAKEQLTWGPGGRWKFTHADIDTLLGTRIPETYPYSYKVIFTMENADEVLSQHNPNNFFDYPDSRLQEALDDLLRYEKPYVDNWDNRKTSNHPHLDNPNRQSRASDHFKAILLNELYKRNEHLPEYVKYGVIQEGDVKRMQLYLCLYDNRDYGKWMAMSENESAFKDARKEFEQDLPS